MGDSQKHARLSQLFGLLNKVKKAHPEDLVLAAINEIRFSEIAPPQSLVEFMGHIAEGNHNRLKALHSDEIGALLARMKALKPASGNKYAQFSKAPLRCPMTDEIISGPDQSQPQ